MGTPNKKRHVGLIFYQVLPEALNRLLLDNSALAQVEASVVYHMIIEGVLAETGYHGFYQALKGRNLLPGLVQGIELVQRDEARHIAFGVYFLQRHVQAGPKLWGVIEERMNELLPAALARFFFSTTSSYNEVTDPDPLHRRCAERSEVQALTDS